MSNYEFDPTGSDVNNKVVDELLPIEGNVYNDFRLLLPTYGPYFKSGLNITLSDDTPLVEGVDYDLTHKFLSASHSVGKGIYGGILILNDALTGSIKITYQALGGIWVFDVNNITNLLMNSTNDPRGESLESSIQLPEKFPVIDHDYNLTDLVGIENTIAAIQEVLVSKLSDGGVSLHAYNLNNPHNITKAKLGLDHVKNFPLADRNQAMAGEHSAYITPETLNYVLNSVLFALNNQDVSSILTEINALDHSVNNYNPPTLKYTNDPVGMESGESVSEMVTPKLLKLYVIKKVLEETVRYTDDFEPYFGNMATDVWIKGMFQQMKYTSLFTQGMVLEDESWVTSKWVYDLLDKMKAELVDLKQARVDKYVTPKVFATYFDELGIGQLDGPTLDGILDKLDNELNPPIYRDKTHNTIKTSEGLVPGWYEYENRDYLVIGSRVELDNIVALYANDVTTNVTKNITFDTVAKDITLDQVVTSNITDMSDLFKDLTDFNQFISSWDLSNVTTMSGMFSGAATFDQPIGNWDINQVTTLKHTFNGASSFNQNISGWNVSNVTTYSYFRDDSALTTANTPPKFL